MSGYEYDLSPATYSDEENLDYLTQSHASMSFKQKSPGKDSDVESQDFLAPKPPGKKRQRRKKEVDPEKELKKIEKSKEKLIISLAKRHKKNIQPGECMKLIEVTFDSELKNHDFYNEAVQLLKSESVTYSASQLIVPSSIKWTRIIEDYTIVENTVNETRRKEEEKQLMIIWRWDEAVKKVSDKSFVPSIESISQLSPGLRLNLIIYGIEGYFKYHQAKHKVTIGKLYENIKNVPQVSREELQDSLIDIQINFNCSNKLVQHVTDVSLLIYQYTKAVAEIPFKMETRSKLETQMNFYAAGDNKNPIKVDKDGFGLKKLWLKQLCSFTNTTLNVAEAICNLYPSPHDLIEAYENCSFEEGQKLLKDIPIKRAAGNSTADRKLGPELSKKVHILFTSDDPNELLS